MEWRSAHRPDRGSAGRRFRERECHGAGKLIHSRRKAPDSHACSFRSSVDQTLERHPRSLHPTTNAARAGSITIAREPSTAAAPFHRERLECDQAQRYLAELRGTAERRERRVGLALHAPVAGGVDPGAGVRWHETASTCRAKAGSGRTSTTEGLPRLRKQSRSGLWKS
jgi:hypothetical protein